MKSRGGSQRFAEVCGDSPPTRGDERGFVERPNLGLARALAFVPRCNPIDKWRGPGPVAETAAAPPPRTGEVQPILGPCSAPAHLRPAQAAPATVNIRTPETTEALAICLYCK